MRLVARALPLLLSLLGLLAGLEPVRAQEEGWNGPRVMDLVERARRLRQEAAVDSALRSYSAEARGFVYFFVDREDSAERTLVKADQLALQIFWEAPGRTRQRIVGRRDERLLPTSIQYHLDHLTVVQDDFGDRIRMGEGDEVSSVVHPAAPGSHEVYDFRLADSVTISFPDGPDPVRVYEVRVRPRDMGAPGFLGSVFLDQSSAAIVRMSFTFTPASYIDPYLDYIRISLDNALWLERFWLPHRQQTEIRREIPILDLPTGSVIRGVYRIGGYRLNPDLPDGFFLGSRIVALPRSVQEGFDFEEGLYADLDREGLVPTPELDEVRGMAARMTADRYLSGLGRLRLHADSASDVARYNRAEGPFLKLGASFRPTGSLRLLAGAGFAFGREKPSLELRVVRGPEGGGSGMRLSLNRLRDVGPIPGSSGVVNSLAGLLDDTDFLDPWFSSGAGVFHHQTLGPLTLRLGTSWERHRSARNVLGEEDPEAGFRPVRAVERGEEWALELGLRTGLGAPGLSGEVRATGATFQGREYLGLRADLTWDRAWLARGLRLQLEARGGRVSGPAPPQALFLLGGRETLPGHPYRSMAGDAFWLISAEASRTLLRPWADLRILASSGRTHLLDGGLPPGWAATVAGGVRGSLGAGFGLLWDVLHLDVVRGVGQGGDWETVLSVTHRFRRWL